MKIKQNTVVALTYDLYKKTNDEEIFLEKADESNPLIFLYGTGMMLPKFEENLSGFEPGDSYDFHLMAEEAYGNKDEDASAELPLEMFKDVGHPQINSFIPLQDNDGNHFNARVASIKDNAVTVDLNHPMAGQDLHFVGKIVQVREASPDELSHGHAHGIEGDAGH
ncbi:MAG: peptidylprolyl isomerase [Flavobacterium sp.]|nr:peptidylprolyl isomerase [Pedobacter sp.]